MAKAIEETPTLEGKDAKRLLHILNNHKNIKLSKHEKDIKVLIRNLPQRLQIV